jgi:hypothetical protein
VSKTTRPAARPVLAFRSVTPSGVVVSTSRMPRWMGGHFETVMAFEGRVSEPFRSAGRGEALVVHNDVCEGINGRGWRPADVVAALVDMAEVA